MKFLIFLMIMGTVLSEVAKGVYKIPKLRITQDMWEADIQTHLDLFCKFYNDRDFTALSKLFTKDCVVMPPGAPQGTGQKAAYRIYSALPEMGINSLELSSHGVIANRNQIAVNTGMVTMWKADGTSFDVCKYLVVWKLVNGTPTFQTAIWNSDAPGNQSE